MFLKSLGNSLVAQWLEGFPGDSVVKNPPAIHPPILAGDAVSIPGLRRTPGEGNGNPLQYPCLGNPMTEEPSGLQSTRLQKSQTSLSNETTTTRS